MMILSLEVPMKVVVPQMRRKIEIAVMASK